MDRRQTRRPTDATDRAVLKTSGYASRLSRSRTRANDAPALVRPRQFGVRYDADSHAPSGSLLLTSNADGKVNKITIEPLHEGKPAGPPGFYTEIGGVIPAPPAAEAAALAAEAAAPAAEAAAPAAEAAAPAAA